MTLAHLPAPRALRVKPHLGRAWWKAQAIGVAPALLAMALAIAVSILGWRGVDYASQAYRVMEIQTHGITLWDSGWYGGELPLNYSILFPLLGALLTIPVVAVLGAFVATWAFDRLVVGFFGCRPLGTWYFAVSTLLPVSIGQMPFLTGEAFGLCALLALSRRRRGVAVGLGLLSALCSPLAAAFLAMACLAWAAHNAGGRRWLVVTAAVSLGIVGLIALFFPGDGAFPFPWTGLVVTELLCLTALTPLVKTTPAVRLAVLFYAVATFVSFMIPNPLGGNAPRLAAQIGVPLLACFVTAPGPALARLSPARLLAWALRGRVIDFSPRWRVAAVGLVVPFAVWQWAPSASVVVTPSAHPELTKAYYQPLLEELEHLSHGPIRIEVPPTLEHWEAAYLAPRVSLARGWERQLDVGDNGLFYTPGALTSSSYSAWLDAEGITWVALPTAALDYAAKDEAVLLLSGTIGNIQQVWQSQTWRLWRVVGSPGLVSGPAKLTKLGPDSLQLSVSRPGDVVVRVRYTAFWKVTRGMACLQPTADGWTSVQALEAGVVTLSARVIGPGAGAGCPGG